MDILNLFPSFQLIMKRVSFLFPDDSLSSQPKGGGGRGEEEEGKENGAHLNLIANANLLR